MSLLTIVEAQESRYSHVLDAAIAVRDTTEDVIYLTTAELMFIADQTNPDGLFGRDLAVLKDQQSSPLWLSLEMLPEVRSVMREKDDNARTPTQDKDLVDFAPVEESDAASNPR